MEWRIKANCLGVDPETFFPTGATVKADIQTKKAKEICKHCEVISDCKEWALHNALDGGIFGGLDEFELKQTRKDLNIPVLKREY